MLDLDNDTAITAFLLETLGDEDKERVLARMEEDEDFAERVVAMEEDLIHQWHRGSLPPRERELFAKVYATPARRRRVEEVRMLMRVTDMASSPAPERVVAIPPAAAAARNAARAIEPAAIESAGVASWLASPLPLSRWAALPVAAAIAGAFVSGAYFGARRAPTVEHPAAGGSKIATITLSAIGEKGPPAARGFDPFYVPEGTTTIQLTVDSLAAPAAALTAEIATPDRAIVLPAGAPEMGRSPTGTTLTITVPANKLPDGDYVLTLHSAAAGQTDAVISTQAFRVIRLSSSR